MSMANFNRVWGGGVYILVKARVSIGLIVKVYTPKQKTRHQRSKHNITFSRLST